jgi:hypothetical protein
MALIFQTVERWFLIKYPTFQQRASKLQKLYNQAAKILCNPLRQPADKLQRQTIEDRIGEGV